MSTHLDGVRRDEPLLDVPETEKPEPKRPPLWRVHGALILGQCIFGGGSIVGKLGVARFNPMVFALLREVAAGILLMMFALYQDGRVRLHRRDAPIFLGCGVFIFTNQAAFIVGDKLAGAVLASAWQPTQPVFTLLISIGLGWERCTLGKAAGILISFGGAAFMVTFGQDLSGAPATQALVGNLLLFLNCLGTCLYVICAKLALARGYPPSTVTAWSYVCGAPHEPSSPSRPSRLGGAGAHALLLPARRSELHGDRGLRLLVRLRARPLRLSHRGRRRRQPPVRRVLELVRAVGGADLCGAAAVLLGAAQLVPRLLDDHVGQPARQGRLRPRLLRAAAAGSDAALGGAARHPLPRSLPTDPRTRVPADPVRIPPPPPPRPASPSFLPVR